MAKKKSSRSTPKLAARYRDHQKAFDLVMDLMAIPGTSGEEAGVAEYIMKRLLKAGVDPKWIKQDTANQRTKLRGDSGNLILKLPGNRPGPRRMLSAHMDTVPICVGCQPRLQGTYVDSSNPKTGLGADDRAGVAVILNAVLEILAKGIKHPPLTVCWFVQEEIGLHGARALSKGLLGNPKLAFNWDGGSPSKLTVGATGGYRIEINVNGLASHAGGAPEKGVSAIAIASLAIADLCENGWHGDIHKSKKHGTSNVGIIHGGAATNVVTDHVFVRAEARSHDPKFRKQIVSAIEKAFKNAVKRVKNNEGKTGSVEINGSLDYEAFLLKADELCVQVAQAAVETLGREPLLAVANGGVDANWLYQHGIPAVTIGCGQRNAHMVTEALDLDDFFASCQVGLRLATATEME